MTPKMREIKKSEASLNYLEYISRVARTYVLTVKEIDLARQYGFEREARRLEDARDELMEELDEATRLIDELDDMEANVLRHHYLYKREYEDIGRDVGYSRSSIVQFAMRGRTNLYDRLPYEWQHSVVM